MHRRGWMRTVDLSGCGYRFVDAKWSPTMKSGVTAARGQEIWRKAGGWATLPIAAEYGGVGGIFGWPFLKPRGGIRLRPRRGICAHFDQPAPKIKNGASCRAWRRQLIGHRRRTRRVRRRTQDRRARRRQLLVNGSKYSSPMAFWRLMRWCQISRRAKALILMVELRISSGRQILDRGHEIAGHGRLFSGRARTPN